MQPASLLLAPSASYGLSLQSRPVLTSAAAGLFSAVVAARKAMTLQLGYTCLLLFAGAMLAGSLPLCVPITERQLGVAAAFSAGLLIGAGLSVVLPEGFEAFHNAIEGAYTHTALSSGFSLVLHPFLLLDLVPVLCAFKRRP